MAGWDDPLQDVINNLDDNRLNLILQFGDMAFKMAGPKGKLIKHLSKDTATCIHQTCYVLVDLCRYLLNTTQNYVLLGQFTSDHPEKEYGILRQGSGGTYFLSVQQVIEKLCIKHASLLLKLNVDIDKFCFCTLFWI